jgi:hypothetical protein
MLGSSLGLSNLSKYGISMSLLYARLTQRHQEREGVVQGGGKSGPKSTKEKI